MERRRVVYSGRVQGVGFRATAHHVAGGLRVSGWVRNEPDHTVLLEVQGTAAEVDRFLEALRRAMGVRIRSESSSSTPIVEGETAFEIRR